MAVPTPLPAFPRVALFGAGTVGTAVAVLLQRSGCEIVGVWSRSDDSARRAQRHLQTDVLDISAEMPAADLILIGASDAGIAEVAERLAGHVREGAVAAHLSGSLGLAVLAPLVDAGASGLACHPVQACPDIPTAVERLPGSAWGVTASPGLEGWAYALISEKLQGTAVAVPEEVRPLWHSASVMTSNGIAALLSFGESILASIGIEQPVSVLGPLAAGTVANARSGGGGGKTLTGPIVRGEVGTVTRHLAALRTSSPHLVDDYLRVGRVILGAAVEAGRLDEDTARSMQEVLA